MVAAWGVDGRQGDFYLAYNTIVAAQDETALLFAFGGQETTLFRNRWVGSDSLLLGDGYLYGEGNWLRRGASLYSFSGTIFNAASISCPAWMPAIAWPSFEPGRGKVVRTAPVVVSQIQTAPFS